MADDELAPIAEDRYERGHVGAAVRLNRRRFVLTSSSFALAACGPRREPKSLTLETQLPPTPAATAFPVPDAARSAGPPRSLGQADSLEAEVERARALHAERGWTVLAEAPFIVIGDGSLAQVERHASTTIRWAVRMLEASYFEAPPLERVTVYLFETAESYRRNVLELFDEQPDTPFGYYSPRHSALVMNIGTGGGTLVHEIVHPYMAANFPACPSWFDEGLASLYEQSAELDGRIMGLTNWRLEGLQVALRAGQVPSFETLCNTGAGFYSEDPGTNYAQARYLCYWLQQQGLLRDFYRSFLAAAQHDASGYATLSSFIGPDMQTAFERWTSFCLALRYP